MPGSCGLISGPASEVAQAGLANVQNIANNAVNRTVYTIGLLQDFMQSLEPVIADIELEDRGQLSRAFQRGAKPSGVALNLNVPTLDYNPALAEVEYTRTATAPEAFGKSAPALNLPSQPSAVTMSQPSPIPTVVERTMPDVPTDSIPDVPQLRALVIPNVPQLELPDFSATDPGDLNEQTIPTFQWTETAYTPTNVTAMSSQISGILGGSSGIPDSVWEQIRSRSARQIRRLGRQAREEAVEQWADRNFSLPVGAERQRVKEASLVELEQLADNVREIAIRDSQVAVERLNVALGQGVALEGLLIGLHNEQAQRSLEAERVMIDVAAQLAQLRVTVYNARVQGFLARAQAFQTEVQGEIAKLERTKVELEQQAVVGQLNQQRLELYRAEVEGVTAKYGLFESQVKAVVGQIEGDRVRVQAFGEQVESFKAVHEAKAVEWRGYGSAVEAEVQRMQGFKIEADAYQSRWEAYRAGVQADSAEAETRVAMQRLKLDRLGQSIDKFKVLLDADVARLDALAREHEQEVRAWEGEGRLEESRTRSDDRRSDLLLRDAELRANVLFRNLERNIAHAEHLQTLQFNGLNADLQANMQISASALTSLNYAATISDDVSNSTGCTTTYAL